MVIGTRESDYVVDLNRVNGVTRSGQRVQSAVLCDQDALAIDPFRLKVQIAEEARNDRAPFEWEPLADTAVIPNHSLRRVK